MYISQVPEENNQDNQAKTVIRKKSKASYIVFLVNLFLMAIAFFVVKNKDKNRLENQDNEDNSNITVQTEAVPVVEETQEKTDTSSPNNSPDVNIGTGATAPPVKTNNTASNIVSKTDPPVLNTTKKKSTKTKTS